MPLGRISMEIIRTWGLQPDRGRDTPEAEALSAESPKRVPEDNTRAVLGKI